MTTLGDDVRAASSATARLLLAQEAIDVLLAEGDDTLPRWAAEEDRRELHDLRRLRLEALAELLGPRGTRSMPVDVQVVGALLQLPVAAVEALVEEAEAAGLLVADGSDAPWDDAA